MIALVTSLGAGLEWGPRAILPLAVFLHVYLLWAPELPQWLPLVVLAIGLWPWGWRRIFRGGDPRVAIALVLVVIGVVLALHSRARLANHGHPFNNSRFPGASLSIIRWARRATSPDAVFLVDPEWSYFREMAQRPVYVTWKDGSAMLWNRPYAATWLERMRALGFDPLAAKVRDAVHGAARGQNSYQALDESQVEAIRAQAPVTFWVAPADHVSPWPEVFTNGAYRVLRVPAAP